jgi:hypothetical protein
VSCKFIYLLTPSSFRIFCLTPFLIPPHILWNFYSAPVFWDEEANILSKIIGIIISPLGSYNTVWRERTLRLKLSISWSGRWKTCFNKVADSDTMHPCFKQCWLLRLQRVCYNAVWWSWTNFVIATLRYLESSLMFLFAIPWHNTGIFLCYFLFIVLLTVLYN